MKHKTYRFVLVSIALLILGCKVEKKDEVVAANKKSKASVVKAQQLLSRELRLDDVVVETVGRSQPNIYDMVFSWPASADRVRVTYNGQVLFTINTAESTQFELSNLQGGKTYPLLIEILDQQNHIINSETKNIEIPMDYVFPKNITLTGNLKINNERVFMSNSLITTQSYNLEISTKKLIVLEKSYIQSFELMTKAGYGQEGRHGGAVIIQADSAEGDLDITMNSEAGGDGFKGYESPSCGAGKFCFGRIHCAWGTKGKSAGRNGDLIIKISDTQNFKLYHQEILAAGGLGGPTLTEATDPNYPLAKENRDCKFPPGKEPAPHGASAQPGKICLILSNLIPDAGCG